MNLKICRIGTTYRRLIALLVMITQNHLGGRASYANCGCQDDKKSAIERIIDDGEHVIT
jgi:hypothetical protein